MIKTTKDSHTIMTELVMPNDTNPLHNLMGGNLMRWMDICTGICASRHAGVPSVTASVDHISFHKPIRLGQVITIESQVTRAWNSSMEVFCKVLINDYASKNSVLSNHAYFTFVALNPTTKKPTAVPELKPETDEEIQLWESAERRREVRLILSGRMRPEEADGLIDFFSSVNKK